MYVKFINNVVTLNIGFCFEVRYHGDINKFIFKIHIMVCCVIFTNRVS